MIVNNSTSIKTTNKFFDYETLNDVDIDDIIISLSNKCRFNGHVHNFYSVLEHSVLVYIGVRYFEDANLDTILWSLFHDAHEAYIMDIPTPLKTYMKNHNITIFKELEEKIDQNISKLINVNLYNVDFKLVKKWDRILLENEIYYLLSNKIKIENYTYNCEFKNPNFDIFEHNLITHEDFYSLAKDDWIIKFNDAMNKTMIKMKEVKIEV